MGSGGGCAPCSGCAGGWGWAGSRTGNWRTLGGICSAHAFHTHDRANLTLALFTGVAIAWAIGYLEPAHRHEHHTHSPAMHSHNHDHAR